MTPSPQPIYDVAVLGLGGMGAAAAWHCARHGAKVLGLEQFGPVHDRGSSHGEWRIYREAYFESPVYAPLAVRAGELWEELGRIEGVPMLKRCGALMVSSENSPVHLGCLKSATQHLLPYELPDAARLHELFPALRHIPGQAAFFEPRAGAVRVEQSITAHLKLAENAGANLRFNERVQNVRDEQSDEGVTIETDSGSYCARRLISAAGAWSGKILDECGCALRPARVVQAWFESNLNALPVDRLAPVFFIEAPDSTWLYGVPPADPSAPGASWKFGFHNRYESCDPDTVRRTVSGEEIDAFRYYLNNLLPGLVGKFKRANVCLYEMTPDEHFAIGIHPRRPSIVVAGGFSGHGFKFTPVVGEILAELALDNRTRYDIAFFSPDRLHRSTFS